MILEHFMICQRFGKPVNKNGNFHMMATVALNCYNPSKTIQGNLLSFLGCSVPMSQDVLVLQSSVIQCYLCSLMTESIKKRVKRTWGALGLALLYFASSPQACTCTRTLQGSHRPTFILTSTSRER